MQAQTRHIEFNVPVAQFDDSAAIRFYAVQFYEDGYQHETIHEAAERVAGLLKDPSAGTRFKGAVRKMRRGRVTV